MVVKVFIVMGVTCSGKSSLGRALAERAHYPFFDGDDYHPVPNIAKMSKGIPLTDYDRLPWLNTINQLVISHLGTGAVIACSALKSYYRQIISSPNELEFIYLKSSKELIVERMALRKEHFMSSNLIDSQFHELEEPKAGALILDASQSIATLLDKISHYYAIT